MSIQTRSQANHLSPKHVVIAGIAAAAVAIAAIVPFTRQDSSSSAGSVALAPSFSSSQLSQNQRFNIEMDQHEALTAVVFGALEVSNESIVAGAIAEHGAYFPVEASSEVVRSAEASRAIAEHSAYFPVEASTQVLLGTETSRAIAEHGAYFPIESEPALLLSADVSRALAEHWALIEPFVS